MREGPSAGREEGIMEGLPPGDFRASLRLGSTLQGAASGQPMRRDSGGSRVLVISFSGENTKKKSILGRGGVEEAATTVSPASFGTGGR